MAEEIYRQLCKTMAKRGGMYPGMDIPEFYELVQELFSLEEAAISNALPRGFNKASAIAEALGKSEEESHCGKPDDVCLQLGRGAQFVIDRGLGRKIDKEEAMRVLDRSEEAGLVHCTNNRQKIDFLCNCCSCHCVILKNALAHPKPGLATNSGFQPCWDFELCISCETCIERCPMDAIKMNDNDKPHVNPDRCIGCGVCATGCPSEAIEMEERGGIPEPPVDYKALKEAIKASVDR